MATPEATETTAKAPVKRATRARRKPAAETAEAPSTAATEDIAATAVAATDMAAQPAEAAAGQGAGEEAAPAKTRVRRTRKTASAPADEGSAAGVAVPPMPTEPPAMVAEDTASAAEPAEDAAVAKAPRKRRKAQPRTEAPEVAVDSAAPQEAAVETAPDAAGAESGTVAEPGEADTSGSTVPATRSTRTRARRTAAPKATQESPDAAGPDASPTDTSAPAPSGTEPSAAEPSAAEPVSGQATENTAAAGEEAEEANEPAVLSPFAVPESPVQVLFHAPDLTAVRPVRPAAAEEETDEDEESGRRRSRRNRRSKGRNRADAAETGTETETETQGEGAEEAATESGDGVTARRRRRRRRGDQDLELTGGQDDDPPNTVTRVRAPRPVSETPPSDRVSSVKGSTRLEAKKQRRRESRETGRRRQVITEAEFLARRESVDRQMIVRQRDDRIQIGVLEDGVLAEHFVSKTQQDSLIGNVYVGKVQNVLPSMEAAFVDIGRGRNAVLYAGEVNWEAAHLEGQPRRIENALKSGDSVLVQVTKDPVGHKGARLTSQISLPGRFLVYVPGGSMTGISRKLPDVERNRLKKILKEHVPEGAGVIVRTAAEGASEEELMNDINRLRAQWEGIERKSTSNKTLPPELLYAEPDLTIKVVRDVFNEDFSKLIVSGEEAWDTIEAYVTYVAPDLVDRLEKWTGADDIFAANRIDEQIHKALERKVFLPSGGSLVIDRTEAMTVVDVNTGKFTGSGGNLEETVTKNNLEAAEEVVRQLRLRDIGGIIVIDFIDMVLEANRDLVLRRLVECLGRDRTKHQVAEVTSLGLVQMTRKRMGTGLLEVFGENCEHCGGRGVVTHDEPLEHRRAAVAAEHHQHLVRAEKPGRPEKPSRSEKRRSKSQNNQGAAPSTPDNVVEPEHEDDAERQAKAQAARAALASIAAATHAAHEAEEHEAARKAEPAATPEAPVLTINGEKVVLPRAEHSPVAAREEPVLTLASLTDAFNKVSPEIVTEPEPETQPEPAGKPEVTPTPAPEAKPEVTAPPERRGRRRRAASSPQGSANQAPIEQRDGMEQSAKAAPAVQPASGAGGADASAGHEEAGAKPDAEKKTPVQPVILGVGVPASEL
ncbi:ribonuclease E/G [Arthrobacter crystallopoietes]|nr:ribonuclease E/G [Arthrobacter crystallopoietes]